MKPDDTLAAYHRVQSIDPSHDSFEDEVAFTKPGMRGFPDLPGGIEPVVRRAPLAARSLVDASGGAGIVALVARARGVVERATVLDASAAALACADAAVEGTGIELASGATWDLPVASSERIVLLPPADRGNVRVRADIRGAYRALEPNGTLLLVLHKDLGAKRYEGEAAELFGNGVVLERKGGWRITRLVKAADAPEVPPVEPLRFEAAGLELEAEPGVFAAGKLDAGSALLLASVDLSEWSGARVLDLGCGYGPLALKASLAGAAVTALDDDLLAVRSAHRNAARYGLDVRCLHSDVGAALAADERFDAVVTNPPFHVGKRVYMEVPLAFLATARRHLAPGGRLVLVANRALEYETPLGTWADVRVVREDGNFKVLEATKRR